MIQRKVKFASQADPKILGQLKKIAAKEGRALQSVLDEAFRDYLEKKAEDRPRKHVMDLVQHSLKAHDAFYARMQE